MRLVLRSPDEMEPRHVTLILSLLTPAFVIQVGDRLLTQDDGRAVTTFDPWSNKQLLFLAADGVFCVGYAGTAYLGGLPTDHVIAAALGGFPEDDELATIRMFGERLPQPAKEALRVLQVALQGHLARDRDAPLWVEVAGWWLGRRGIRPVLTSFARTAPAGSLDVRHCWQISAAMSAVADAEPRIGRDCASVLLPPPVIERPITIGFHPHAAQPQILVQTAAGARAVTGGFSPWLVTAGVVRAPSFIAGGGTAIVGGLSVRYAIPQAPSAEGLTIVSHQRRPRAPASQ